MVLLAAGTAGVAAVALLVGLWARHRVVRTVDRLTLRLDPGGALPDGRGLRRALHQLERAAGRVRDTAAEEVTGRGRFASALDALPLGIVVADAHGRPVLRNAAARSFVGTTYGDAIVAEAVAQLLADAAAGHAEERRLSLYGPPRRTVVVSATPIGGYEGGGAVVVISDDTQRARLEAVRTDFVANISHELRTPVGALAVLAETLDGEQDPAIRDRMSRRIVHEAHRVARIIEDLLELSSLEGRPDPVREPVPVRALVAEAVERVRWAAEQRGVLLDVVEGPAHLQVPGDRSQLVSALGNLLDNAVKYSDRGATVRVRARSLGPVVEVVVADEGIGIPARDLERIFERFYRVDRARSRETGGTGLGLAIVRHVVDNHAGEVAVESREGEGSTFTIRLPAGTGPAAVELPEAG